MYLTVFFHHEMAIEIQSVNPNPMSCKSTAVEASVRGEGC
jgi:hypothetical protein